MCLAESDHPSSPDPILLGGAALTLGAFALRLHGLEQASFWLDELFTVGSCKTA